MEGQSREQRLAGHLEIAENSPERSFVQSSYNPELNNFLASAPSHSIDNTSYGAGLKTENVQPGASQALVDEFLGLDSSVSHNQTEDKC